MVTKKPFGITSTGQEATLYTITQTEGGFGVAVSDYGATVVSIYVTDRDGATRDVVLGFDDVTGYEEDPYYFGAFVGRNANRIKDAEILIGGKRYLLAKNEGEHCLHSGPDAWKCRLFQVESVTEDSITFLLVSPDLDQGFPGEMEVHVTYTVRGGRLTIAYEATPEEDTVVNLTNHSYFNLKGHDGGDVLSHLVWINADSYVEVDEELIPTGTILPVADSAYDFRERHPFGAQIDPSEEPVELTVPTYDINFCRKEEEFGIAANAYAPETGILMNVYTDCPGVQVYSPKDLAVRGKQEAIYGPYAAVCFETQFYPDAVHQPGFQSPIVRKGKTFTSTTVYEFQTVSAE